MPGKMAYRRRVRNVLRSAQAQKVAAALSDTKQHPAFRALVAKLANHQEFTKDLESLTSVIVA